MLCVDRWSVRIETSHTTGHAHEISHIKFCGWNEYIDVAYFQIRKCPIFWNVFNGDSTYLYAICFKSGLLGHKLVTSSQAPLIQGKNFALFKFSTAHYPKSAKSVLVQGVHVRPALLFFAEHFVAEMSHLILGGCYWKNSTRRMTRPMTHHVIDTRRGSNSWSGNPPLSWKPNWPPE